MSSVGGKVNQGLNDRVIAGQDEGVYFGLCPYPALTPRERQVLERVKEGLSNRKVARALGISERTVKVHLHSIFLKLGVASRTEAVVAGIRTGRITLN